MNKNLLKVIIPFALIIIVIVLSISNIGFKLETKFVKSVSYDDLFTSGMIKQVKIATVNAENDFFLPRSFELPRFIACLYDENGKTNPEQLFARWDQIGTSEIYYDQPIPVDISWFGKKQIDLVTDSRGPYYKTEPYPVDRINATDYSKEFDKVLLIEVPEDQFNRGCYNVNTNDVSNAVKINIQK